MSGLIQRLTALNEENSKLIARTLELTVQFSYLKEAAIAVSSMKHIGTCFFINCPHTSRHSIFSSMYTLYDLLGRLPTDSADILTSNAHYILLLLYCDKNPAALSRTTPLTLRQGTQNLSSL